MDFCAIVVGEGNRKPRLGVRLNKPADGEIHFVAEDEPQPVFFLLGEAREVAGHSSAAFVHGSWTVASQGEETQARLLLPEGRRPIRVICYPIHGDAYGNWLGLIVTEGDEEALRVARAGWATRTRPAEAEFVMEERPPWWQRLLSLI